MFDRPYLYLDTRTLSKREAAVIGWLEAERRNTVSVKDVSDSLRWSRQSAWAVLHRLSKKRWLKRIAKGRYETILAETGGFAPDNPWAALSTWKQRYFVGFQSASYEHGFTPTRPGRVQACVSAGARKPLAWGGLPIRLLWQRNFSAAGVATREIVGWPVSIAGPERAVLDSAALPSHAGGIHGLSYIVARSHSRLDWELLLELSRQVPKGVVALRRLGTLLEVLHLQVPEELANALYKDPPSSRLFLGERRIFGACGPSIKPWNVVLNVDPEALLEEVRR